jgi:hypothetical protein
MCWVTGILGLFAAFWVLLVKDVWRLRPAAVLAGSAGSSPADGPVTSGPPGIPPQD